jgi:hypothetical protein
MTNNSKIFEKFLVIVFHLNRFLDFKFRCKKRCFKVFDYVFIYNETPRGKQRGIKIPTAQDKSRSKLRETYPERD